ncbi:ATP-binding protein [Streptomyces sp. NPDC094447]|uniref:ATP-binding protein n=1 Tax=Streptomyces sp. NPDC094447 TaxID=3366062 RepID=UPI00380A8451
MAASALETRMCTIGLLETVKTGKKTGARHDRSAVRKSAGCVMDAVDVSVPALRRFARETVSRWGVLSDDADLALVVTELVGNVVRHSKGTEVCLLLSATASTLTVEVRDNGRWHDHPVPTPDELACSGRGLQLVKAYSAYVLVRTSTDGTRVVVTMQAS